MCRDALDAWGWNVRGSKEIDMDRGGDGMRRRFAG
jgi:hypothetical protein